MENVIGLGGNGQVYQKGGSFNVKHCLFKNGNKFCELEGVNLLIQKTVFEFCQSSAIKLSNCVVKFNEVTFVDCDRGIVEANFCALKINKLNSTGVEPLIHQNTGCIAGSEDDLFYCELGSTVRKVD